MAQSFIEQEREARAYNKAFLHGRSSGLDDGKKIMLDRVSEIIDDADKKAGDKAYIVLDDGSFYSQAKYIKDKMLELLGK